MGSLINTQMWIFSSCLRTESNQRYFKLKFNVSDIRFVLYSFLLIYLLIFQCERFKCSGTRNGCGSRQWRCELLVWHWSECSRPVGSMGRRCHWGRSAECSCLHLRCGSRDALMMRTNWNSWWNTLQKVPHLCRMLSSYRKFHMSSLSLYYDSCWPNIVVLYELDLYDQM